MSEKDVVTLRPDSGPNGNLQLDHDTVFSWTELYELANGTRAWWRREEPIGNLSGAIGRSLVQQISTSIPSHPPSMVCNHDEAKPRQARRKEIRGKTEFARNSAWRAGPILGGQPRWTRAAKRLSQQGHRAR